MRSCCLTLCATVALFLHGWLAVAGEPAAFPPPKELGDPARLGQGIQRTMTLLATSTPRQRHTVKILFYGQSITEQTWWQAVAGDLRRRFPHANLIIENRALGGFSSQRLVKTAETDLYPFQPDLLIFYVYGSHLEYENIIRRTLQRTAAEILMQTDHLTADDQLKEETDPQNLRPDGKIWNSFMNYRFLPDVAKQYGCGLVDQRNLWKAYLTANKLPAKQLLRDGVHLNDHGNYLMAELVKAYLVCRDDVRIDPLQCDAVKTLAVGKDVSWENGKLTLEFTGNRVDVVLREGQTPVQVRIDGKRPSELPELYGVTRALAKPGGKWPVITNITAERPRVLEDWTMEVQRDAKDEKLFTFTLTGSKTGPDGAGRSDQRFVSNSGRVAIDPDNWDVAYALALAGQKPPPERFTVRWQVVPHFADEIAPTVIKDPIIETVVTVAQNLANGKHTLELTAAPAAPIVAIRVYRPPLTIK